jgi:hypothetical protein
MIDPWEDVGMNISPKVRQWYIIDEILDQVVWSKIP